MPLQNLYNYIQVPSSLARKYIDSSCAGKYWLAVSPKNRSGYCVLKARKNGKTFFLKHNTSPLWFQWEQTQETCKWCPCESMQQSVYVNTMMTSSNGNIRRVTGHLCGEFTGQFPTERPVTLSFDVFFDLQLNKRLRKQSWGWWFETPSRPLWRHRNA